MASSLTRSRLAKLGILAAAGVVAACVPAARQASAPPTLRVMSYNIQAGGGDLARVAATIRGASPDIVGLQEVDVHWSDRSGFADQARELASMLGMEVRFAPIYAIPNADPSRPVREYGVALLSRFPIREWRNDSLTRLSTQDATAAPARMPGMVEALIDANGWRVRVFTTHLDYRADPAIRSRQVTELLGYLGRGGVPTIVTGDLNAGPSAPELQPLFGVLHDAWSAGAGDGLTYPAEKPVKRIDYVLASGHFEPTAASVIQSPASDHRAVIATLVGRAGRAP